MYRDLVEAFVLAGGRSSRFGSDKAQALWAGTPLLARALEAARALGFTPRVVCPDPEPYRVWADVFVTSERPERGPAEGLRAALDAGSREWALVLGTDMPGVDEPLLRALLDALSRVDAAGVTAVCFEDAGHRRHPLPGLYHRSLLDLWPGLGDTPALNSVLDRARLLTIGPAELPFGLDLDRRLHNVNRRDDLRP